MQRSLSASEQAILNKLLDQCEFDVANLRSQAASIEVWSVNEDGSILRFESPLSIPSAPMPAIHFVPVEGVFRDSDGVNVHILLHVRDGRLYELEYLKEDNTKILKTPNAQEISDFTLIK